MVKENILYLYKKEDINWNMLATINIYPEELEASGQMDKLLKGEETDPIELNLSLYGISIQMGGTLQVVEVNGSPMVDIKGLKPEEEEEPVE